MLISIITVNFNNLEGLKKTMNSVLDQSYPNIQYIVIDGASTDGSANFIKSHQYALYHYVSETDTGAYDAMNKGLAKATGHYILFLNSGDYLFNASVIQSFVDSKPDEDIIYGYLEIQERQRRWTKTYPTKLSFSYFLKDSLPHSAGAFFKKSCFVEELSFYDDDLEIMADWKWSMIGLFKKGYSYRCIKATIGVFEFGNGISSFPENRQLLKKERQLILETEFEHLYPEIKSLLNDKKNHLKLMNTKIFKYAAILNRLINKQ